MGPMNFFNKKCQPIKDNPITRLEKEIETWEFEQAQIAIAIVNYKLRQDDSFIKKILGSNATLETAIGNLKIGHMRFLHGILPDIVAAINSEK